MAKKCQRCGKVSKNTATVCQKCGSPLDEEYQIPPKRPNLFRYILGRSKSLCIDFAHSLKGKEFILSAIAAVIAVVLLILLFGGFSK